MPEAEKEYIEIEATGSQFLWYLRYPGRDGKIGTKYFTQINSSNQLGQTWTDEKNMDDFMVSELVLPVNKPVRVRITARDVLHNFLYTRHAGQNGCSTGDANLLPSLLQP